MSLSMEALIGLHMPFPFDLEQHGIQTSDAAGFWVNRVLSTQCG